MNDLRVLLDRAIKEIKKLTKHVRSGCLVLGILAELEQIKMKVFTKGCGIG